MEYIVAAGIVGFFLWKSGIGNSLYLKAKGYVAEKVLGEDYH